MKTVGYVLSNFPVLSETFVGTEIRAMQTLGHKVIPIAFNRPTEGYQPDDAALQRVTRYIDSVDKKRAIKHFFKSPYGWLAALKFSLRQQGISTQSLLLQGAKVALLAKASGCQHLHAHFALHTAATAIVAAKLLGITVSFVGHGFDVYASPWDLPLKLQYADFAVAVCQQMDADFRALQPRASTLLVHCGIELEKFPYSPNAMPENRLLFIGRLTEKKGLPLLINALSDIPDAERPILDIIGKGEIQSALQEQVQAMRLGPWINFLGARDSQWIRQHASQYLGLVAPFCAAKNGDKDTGPLVLKEAMALGLPVISTYFMGCPEIVGENAGLLVPTNDIRALSSAIMQLKSLPSEGRVHLASLARQRIESLFSSSYQAQKLSCAIEASQQ
ncbi:MAG: glycosyltransferase [Hahellaceae bacterium]|nr:glycosyltransferase [Hahellaceae bacterium]MCP5210251.1 glycosyltransferase [Hahellaceae bacterium]